MESPGPVVVSEADIFVYVWPGRPSHMQLARSSGLDEDLKRKGVRGM